MTLGTLLLKLRLQRNKGQKAIAAAINVGQSTYCEWEGDIRLPKTKHLVLLANELGISLNEILKCIPEINPAQGDELLQLKTEIEQLRRRDEEHRQTFQVLMSTIRQLSPDPLSPENEPGRVVQGDKVEKKDSSVTGSAGGV